MINKAAMLLILIKVLLFEMVLSQQNIMYQIIPCINSYLIDYNYLKNSYCRLSIVSCPTFQNLTQGQLYRCTYTNSETNQTVSLDQNNCLTRCCPTSYPNTTVDNIQDCKKRIAQQSKVKATKNWSEVQNARSQQNGLIIGLIVLGSILLLGLLVSLGICCWMLRRMNQPQVQSSQAVNLQPFQYPASVRTIENDYYGRPASKNNMKY